MSPLVETLILIALAIAIVVTVVFVFTNKKERNEEPEPPSPAEQPEIKEEETPIFPAPQCITVKVRGQTVEYKALTKYFETNEGERYQVIQSSSGAIFFIRKNGVRRYLSNEEKQTLKDM